MYLCDTCRYIMEKTFNIKLPADIASLDSISSAFESKMSTTLHKSQHSRNDCSFSKTSSTPKGTTSAKSPEPGKSQTSTEKQKQGEKKEDIDYSNYRGYFGKGRPVTTYAQFIHANKHRYDDNFYEYVTMCARIWKKLDKTQRAVFIDASRRDVIRYRTGKKVPPEIKSVKTITSALPNGPLKRKISRSRSGSRPPSKKRRLSQPRRKVVARRKKRSPSPTKRRPSLKPKGTIKKRKSPRRSPSKHKTKSKPRKVKSRPRKVKSRPRNVKSKPRKVKSRPRKVKSRPRKAKSKPRRAKPQPRKAKSKPRKVKSQPRKATSEQTPSPARKTFGSCLFNFFGRKTYDYSNFKGYVGQNGPVTTYAQFIYANRQHKYAVKGTSYFEQCSKIWKSLDEKQKKIFEAASDKDVDRYHRSSLYRKTHKKHKK